MGAPFETHAGTSYNVRTRPPPTPTNLGLPVNIHFKIYKTCARAPVENVYMRTACTGRQFENHLCKYVCIPSSNLGRVSMINDPSQGTCGLDAPPPDVFKPEVELDVQACVLIVTVPI